MAAQCGYTKTVNELIGKGAEIDTPTSVGYGDKRPCILQSLLDIVLLCVLPPVH